MHITRKAAILLLTTLAATTALAEDISNAIDMGEIDLHANVGIRTKGVEFNFVPNPNLSGDDVEQEIGKLYMIRGTEDSKLAICFLSGTGDDYITFTNDNNPADTFSAEVWGYNFENNNFRVHVNNLNMSDGCGQFTNHDYVTLNSIGSPHTGSFSSSIQYYVFNP